jgi:hypothetical protein
MLIVSCLPIRVSDGGKKVLWPWLQVHFANEHDRQHWQEKVGEMLADKVMYIAEVINDLTTICNFEINLWNAVKTK